MTYTYLYEIIINNRFIFQLYYDNTGKTYVNFYTNKNPKFYTRIFENYNNALNIIKNTIYELFTLDDNIHIKYYNTNMLINITNFIWKI